MSTFLWAVYPYICVTLFFVVPFIRLRKRPFEYTTRASSIFARASLGWASLLMHWGIVLLLVGHAIGIVGAVLGLGSWVVGFFWIGALGGLMALAGSVTALVRRIAVPNVRAMSQHDDYGVHVFLIVIIGLALYQALARWIWGASFNAGLWLASVFRFQPQPELMEGAPIYTQLHVFFALTLFAYFPFTKLVHAWTLPVNYMVRPYVSMRTPKRKFQRRFEWKLRTDTSMLMYSVTTALLLLLATGFLLRTPALPRLAMSVGAEAAAMQPEPSVTDLPGYHLYLGSCARCHGPNGDADVLSKDSHSFAVPPRNLTQGAFRFVSTQNGVASDADLAHVIRHGLPVAGMPGFGFLSAAQVNSIVQVIDYMWVGRPVAGPPVDPGPTPAFTTALVSQGEQMYATMCSACHGEAGRGDGPAAATLAVRPANLAAGRIKAGSDPVQLYYRIATGIKGDTGQAMPAFGALPPDQIWSIVAFLEREVIP
ncbi:MAG: respiratory nitrate reductase subunit gamma [Trueperaceae bacterium]|nr:respiratory nitrate reductase subunit gamma [Trueperaceae bacterium]